MSNEPNFTPSMILKGIGRHASENGAIVYPYSDTRDIIDGKVCHTCGMARVVLMDSDMVSKPRVIIGKHGQEKTVVDIFLTKPEYMVYYTREYVFDAENHVVECNRGHYGEMTSVEKIAKNMRNGKKYVDNARRIWARQEMEKEENEKKQLNVIADDLAKQFGNSVPFIEFS